MMAFPCNGLYQVVGMSLFPNRSSVSIHLCILFNNPGSLELSGYPDRHTNLAVLSKY